MRQGFNAAFLLVGCALLAPGAQPQQVALAFDALSTQSALPLGETQVGAAASGYPPGNHTWSHLRHTHQLKEARLTAGQGENPTASLERACR